MLSKEFRKGNEKIQGNNLPEIEKIQGNNSFRLRARCLTLKNKYFDKNSCEICNA